MNTQYTHSLTTDIVLIDIINFSLLKTTNQLEIINFITKSYTKMIHTMLASSNMSLDNLIHGYIPTGDGFYCILNPRLKGYGAILGLGFNHFSEEISKKYPYFEGFRIAVNSGDIYEFTDILGHKNYIGEGLNDCSRYLEMKDFKISTIIISNSAYDNLKIFLRYHKDFAELLIKREFKYSSPHIFKDKHGKKREGRLVWLRKSGIITPPKLKLTLMKAKNEIDYR